MAPPMAHKGKSPKAACEFLLFLNRAEAAARNDTSNPFLDSEDDDEILRAKVRAYVAALSKKLSCWAEHGCSAEEHYRSRIEELLPTLECSLERRQSVPQTSLPATPVVASPESVLQQQGGSAELARDSTQGSSICAAMESLETSSAILGGGGDAPPLATESTAVDVASSQNTASAHAGSHSPVNAAELPWRRSSARAAGAFPRRSSGLAVGSALRNELESDMLQDIEGMKGAANSFLMTLRKDNENLKKLQDTQDSSLQKVTQETQKGRKMMKSGQLSFLCTMVMLIVSVVIFFMMIPFIIFT